MMIKDKLKPKIASRYMAVFKEKSPEESLNEKSLQSTKRGQKNTNFLIRRKRNFSKTSVSSRPQVHPISSTRRPLNNMGSVKPIITRNKLKLKTLPPIQAEKINNLTGNIGTGTAKKKKKVIKEASDVYEWIKKNDYPKKSKVFIMSHYYKKSLRKCLIDNGWIENRNRQSLCFHLKFGLEGRDIPYRRLEPYQIVNHFENA